MSTNKKSELIILIGDIKTVIYSKCFHVISILFDIFSTHIRKLTLESLSALMPWVGPGLNSSSDSTSSTLPTWPNDLSARSTSWSYRMPWSSCGCKGCSLRLSHSGSAKDVIGLFLHNEINAEGDLWYSWNQGFCWPSSDSA